MTSGEPIVRTDGILLFLLSLLTLVLEVIQVRVFSYSLDPQTVYMAISVALLGFGASAVLLACVPRLRAMEPAKAIATSLVLFGAAALVSNLLFSNVSDFISRFFLPRTGITLASPTSFVFFICSIPFFFAGIGIALGILSGRGAIGGNYFLNMVASGIGCGIVFPLLSSIGAEAAVCLVAGSAMVIGAAYLFRFNRALAGAAVAGAVLCAYLGLNREAFQFAPDAGDFPTQVSAPIIAKHGPTATPKRTFATWDPVGKVEIYQWPGEDGFFHQETPVKLFTQDAGSISVVLGFGDDTGVAQSFARGSTYGAGTILRPGAKVLVIGLGGAPDVLAALANGASHVTAIDINNAAISAVQQESHFMGIDRVPEKISLAHADGRNFVESFPNSFDVIQMTGAETWSAGYVSGSVLSENYLYTKEAFASMFGALRPDGILAVTRFSNEPIRNAATALETLRSLGIRDPSHHVIVLSQGVVWGTVLAKRNEFTNEEIERIRTFAEQSSGYARSNTLPLFEEFGFGISMPVRIIYLPGQALPAGADEKVLTYWELMQAADRDQLPQWYADQSLNYQPTTDDRPFFFQLDRLKTPSLADILGRHRLVAYRWDVVGYIGLTVQFAMLAFVLTVVPALAMQRRNPWRPGSLRITVCFATIGMGFMFIEIGLMQKLTLLLGHPNYAISTVLFSILVFTGIGSYLSTRWASDSAGGLRWAMPAIVVCATMFLTVTPSLLPALIVLPRFVRVMIAVVLVAPVAFFMGFPYPTMLRWVENQRTHFTPLALAINGFASVLASLASIPLSSYFGFRAVLAIGIGMYALAWLSLPIRSRAGALSRGPEIVEAEHRESSAQSALK